MLGKSPPTAKRRNPIGLPAIVSITGASNGKILREFFRRRAQALSDFDCQAVAEGPDQKTYDTHLVLAVDASGDPVGGLCIYTRILRESPLPLESILLQLGYLEAVQKLQRRLRSCESGEIYGLWVNQSHRGIGLSQMLLSAVVSEAKSIGLEALAMICSPHMSPACQALGFQIDHDFGDAGSFFYPDARYRSAVLTREEPVEINPKHGFLTT